MFEKLNAYFYETVVLSFDDYRNESSKPTYGNRRDLNKAMVAAEALFHFREHLPNALSFTRTEAENQCPDYGLLGDIVNAAKHKTINGNTPHGAPLISNYSQLIEMVQLIHYDDDQGEYIHTQKAVMVQLDDGSTRQINEVLTNVTNYWGQYLFDNGVRTSPLNISLPTPYKFRTRDECEQIDLNIAITQGIRFGMAMQLLRYDNATNSVSPIDVSNYNFKGSFRSNMMEVAITLTNESGEEFDTRIKLNGELSAIYNQLPTDEERISFVESLLAKKGIKKKH